MLGKGQKFREEDIERFDETYRKTYDLLQLTDRLRFDNTY